MSTLVAPFDDDDAEDVEFSEHASKNYVKERTDSIAAIECGTLMPAFVLLFLVVVSEWKMVSLKNSPHFDAPFKIEI